MISLLFIRMLGPGISNLMNMVVAFTVTITFLLTIDVQLKKLGWSLASLPGIWRGQVSVGRSPSPGLAKRRRCEASHLPAVLDVLSIQA
jgi:hypothetical protein